MEEKLVLNHKDKTTLSSASGLAVGMVVYTKLENGNDFNYYILSKSPFIASVD